MFVLDLGLCLGLGLGLDSNLNLGVLNDLFVSWKFYNIC